MGFTRLFLVFAWTCWFAWKGASHKQPAARPFRRKATALTFLLPFLGTWVSAQAQQFRWPATQVTATAVSDPLPGEFTWVSGGVLWPDGSAAVADLITPTITYFNPKGDTVWSVGRNGSGPGEFRVVRSLVRCANGEIAVFDASLRRLTFLSAQGKVLHTRQAPQLEAAWLLACQSRTQFVSNVRQAHVAPSPRSGTTFEERRALLLSDGDKQGAVLAEATTVYHYTGMSFSDLPFGERAEAAAGGGYVYLCQAGTGACHAYSTKSKQVVAFTLALPTRPVTDEDWRHERSLREAGLAGLPLPARAGFGATYDALPRTQEFGRFDMVRADDRGRLWVRTYERYRQDTDLWLVLTPTGQPVARVVTPARLEPLAWSGNQFLGTMRDRDGVPVLRRYAAVVP